MNILFLTWKDRKHPQAGGAEVVNEELAKRLVADGHNVTFIVGGFAGAAQEEKKDGFKIIRLGNRFSVYWRAYRYYAMHLKNWPDLVIDEVNTMPFFAKLYVKQKNILFVHQLCREIWFYEMPFPLSLIGYLLEPLYLWLLNDRRVITVSESTKKDLMRYGFKAENISIISEGIELEPVANLASIKKFEKPTILALGSIRSMKRTDHVVRAFEIAKAKISDLQLIVAGDYSGRFGNKVQRLTAHSRYADSITCLGRISVDQKRELLQRSHLLAVTSVKEGWCLVVTEAASQGTPAIVYNVDGLRDSVQSGLTGILCTSNTPHNLAENMAALLGDPEKYRLLREAGWEWSKEINFENSYEEFKRQLP